MAFGSRLSDVILEVSGASTVRVERRLLRLRPTDVQSPPRSLYRCSLPTGETVEWLGATRYRLPDGRVGVAVAHERPIRRPPDWS
ncbi:MULTISPECIES: hypothetical protein [unclassified Achromobacter]|uniref:hypothetical protein n=1 Tax=unclassified Achromobacter TaxID=2626865 RepID=UPI00069ECCA2|nr:MULTISPECIES: hypothetical protein [unclassified Achromobacter]KOF53990.1 hypothetical protein AD428_09760 [Achromobacter sp. DMS1]KOF54017.1 hypothetical protein AD428_09920 [Achromobacter sp. DMS1]